MIRQTDYIRVTDRCYQDTNYPINDSAKSRYPWRTCVYLNQYGQCELTFCVKGRGEHDDRRAI